MKPPSHQLGPAAAVLSILLFGYCGAAIGAEDGPAGLTVPTVLPAFDRDAATCSGRPDLEKVLAFAQDNEREFMQGVKRGLQPPPTIAVWHFAPKPPITTPPG